MNQTETTARAGVVMTSACGTFDVGDVIHAAFFRSELKKQWETLLALVEAERRADDAGESPDDAALQLMSDEFRTERDLISAEETEIWLRERGLSLDDFSRFFVRHYWKNRTDAEAESQFIDYLSAPDRLRELMRVELLLNGAFDEMATQLAWRIAARDAAGASRAEPAMIAGEREQFYERFGLNEATLPAWLDALGRGDAWLGEMLEMEAMFRAESTALITPEAIENTITSLRLPLKRFVVEFIELESLDAAREAALCIRVDCSTVEEVAKSGGYPYRRTIIAFEDLPQEIQQALLSAAPGDVLGPFDFGEGFQVCRLLDKLEPDIADDKTRQRVEEEIVKGYFTELASRYVRWKIAPTNPP
jgi:hypothetical protein